MNPSITLLVMTDGRSECICDTLDSLVKNISYPFTYSLMINDSGNPHYATWLNVRYPTFTKVHHELRRGFAGAVRSAWESLPICDFVFTLEDDFTFNRPVDLLAMVDLLKTFPHLAQVVLKRQAWNSDEISAGGVVELHPDWFTEKQCNGTTYLEHRAFYSTNPNLMPFAITQYGWPNVEHSEGVFSAQLKDLGYSFAYWGARSDPPAVNHIGAQRIGVYY